MPSTDSFWYLHDDKQTSTVTEFSSNKQIKPNYTVMNFRKMIFSVTKTNIFRGSHMTVLICGVKERGIKINF